ncbi:MAG: YfiR family protein, partial [Desulfobacterales bacterium]|nr:YfiR family protein [Desulfobacterales bacterium]
AELPVAEEHLVKSAFIYNFAKFVEWPSGAFGASDAPLVLCILGEDPIQNALASVAGKMIGAHPLVVTPAASVENTAACHMLFIAGAKRGDLAPILNGLARRPVLTIGDSEGFAREGVIINLVKSRGKIRFEINLEAAKRSGLDISSKLLKLAMVVEGSP